MFRGLRDVFLVVLWCTMVFSSRPAFGQDCTFNNTLYNSGDKLPDSCFHLTCISGKWKHTTFDPTCGSCHLQNDPHFTNYDGFNFDLHQLGRFVLTQKMNVNNSPFYVHNTFSDCIVGIPGATCVEELFFKDSADTELQIDISEGSPTNKYMVNGQNFNVNNDPKEVIINGITHHVLVWKDGSCINMVGSSKLSVKLCLDSLDIWASSDYKGTLNGLCGLYQDNNIGNNFITEKVELYQGKRNNRNRVLAPEEFGDSWKVGSSAGIKHKEKNEISVENCALDTVTETNYVDQCNKSLVPLTGGMKKELITTQLDNCLFDLCVMHHGFSGNQTVIEEWLGKLQSVIKVHNDIVGKTKEYEEVAPWFEEFRVETTSLP